MEPFPFLNLLANDGERAKFMKHLAECDRAVMRMRMTPEQAFVSAWDVFVNGIDPTLGIRLPKFGEDLLKRETLEGILEMLQTVASRELDDMIVNPPVLPSYQMAVRRLLSMVADIRKMQDTLSYRDLLTITVSRYSEWMRAHEEVLREERGGATQKAQIEELPDDMAFAKFGPQVYGAFKLFFKICFLGTVVFDAFFKIAKFFSRVSDVLLTPIFFGDKVGQLGERHAGLEFDTVFAADAIPDARKMLAEQQLAPGGLLEYFAFNNRTKTGNTPLGIKMDDVLPIDQTVLKKLVVAYSMTPRLRVFMTLPPPIEKKHRFDINSYVKTSQWLMEYYIELSKGVAALVEASTNRYPKWSELTDEAKSLGSRPEQVIYALNKEFPMPVGSRELVTIFLKMSRSSKLSAEEDQLVWDNYDVYVAFLNRYSRLMNTETLGEVTDFLKYNYSAPERCASLIAKHLVGTEEFNLAMATGQPERLFYLDYLLWKTVTGACSYIKEEEIKHYLGNIRHSNAVNLTANWYLKSVLLPKDEAKLWVKNMEDRIRSWNVIKDEDTIKRAASAIAYRCRSLATFQDKDDFLDKLASRPDLMTDVLTFFANPQLTQVIAPRLDNQILWYMFSTMPKEMWPLINAAALEDVLRFMVSKTQHSIEWDHIISDLVDQRATLRYSTGDITYQIEQELIPITKKEEYVFPFITSTEKARLEVIYQKDPIVLTLVSQLEVKANPFQDAIRLIEQTHQRIMANSFDFDKPNVLLINSQCMATIRMYLKLGRLNDIELNQINMDWIKENTEGLNNGVSSRRANLDAKITGNRQFGALENQYREYAFDLRVIEMRAKLSDIMLHLATGETGPILEAAVKAFDALATASLNQKSTPLEHQIIHSMRHVPIAELLKNAIAVAVSGSGQLREVTDSLRIVGNDLVRALSDFKEHLMALIKQVNIAFPQLMIATIDPERLKELQEERKRIRDTYVDYQNKLTAAKAAIDIIVAEIKLQFPTFGPGSVFHIILDNERSRLIPKQTIELEELAAWYSLEQIPAPYNQIGVIPQDLDMFFAWHKGSNDANIANDLEPMIKLLHRNKTTELPPIRKDLYAHAVFFYEQYHENANIKNNYTFPFNAGVGRVIYDTIPIKNIIKPFTFNKYDEQERVYDIQIPAHTPWKFLSPYGWSTMQVTAKVDPAYLKLTVGVLIDSLKGKEDFKMIEGFMNSSTLLGINPDAQIILAKNTPGFDQFHQYSFQKELGLVNQTAYVNLITTILNDTTIVPTGTYDSNFFIRSIPPDVTLAIGSEISMARIQEQVIKVQVASHPWSLNSGDTLAYTAMAMSILSGLVFTKRVDLKGVVNYINQNPITIFGAGGN